MYSRNITESEGEMTESRTYMSEEDVLQRLSDFTQEAELLELRALVKSFFDDYLSVTEASDSGRIFNPIHISCVRAMKIEPLSNLLNRMRVLSGAKSEN
jgi:hypothetical protein